MERYVGSSLWKEVFALSYVYNKVDTKSDFSPPLPYSKSRLLLPSTQARWRVISVFIHQFKRTIKKLVESATHRERIVSFVRPSGNNIKSK